MAMELLFENHTQLDEDVIHHIIEKDYKRPEKAKQYHVMTLLVGILAALAGCCLFRTSGHSHASDADSAVYHRTDRCLHLFLLQLLPEHAEESDQSQAEHLQ